MIITPGSACPPTLNHIPNTIGTTSARPPTWHLLYRCATLFFCDPPVTWPDSPVPTPQTHRRRPIDLAQLDVSLLFPLSLSRTPNLSDVSPRVQPSRTCQRLCRIIRPVAPPRKLRCSRRGNLLVYPSTRSRREEARILGAKGMRKRKSSLIYIPLEGSFSCRGLPAPIRYLVRAPGLTCPCSCSSQPP